MTTTERVAALWALYEQLDALITPDEIETYPCLEHLGDLIEDLQLEVATDEGLLLEERGAPPPG